jgi:hypothetical protein
MQLGTARKQREASNESNLVSTAICLTLAVLGAGGSGRAHALRTVHSICLSAVAVAICCIYLLVFQNILAALNVQRELQHSFLLQNLASRRIFCAVLHFNTTFSRILAMPSPAGCSTCETVVWGGWVPGVYLFSPI